MARARLEDLSDAPLTTLSRRPEPDAGASAALDVCHALLDDDRYQWAWGTVQGIRTTIETMGTATVKQRQALENIQRGGQVRSETRRWGRRYEGR